MRGLLIGVMLLLATPALASHHPVATIPAYPAFIDVASEPAYQPDTVPVVHYRHHARRHAERRHIAHHEAPVRVAHPIPTEAVPAPVAVSEAAEAATLGQILGIPGGFADGIATSISQSVKAMIDGIGLEVDRAYLAARAADDSPSIQRQGPALAIGRLNPVFVRRLAAAMREADASGMRPCIQSAYRPPGFGIGGFANKYRSAHSYGLAVDFCGIGDPGSHEAITFRRIAARHGVYFPYSVYSNAEWNHAEPCHAMLVLDEAPALRRTITANGPISLDRMWRVGRAVIESVGSGMPNYRHVVHHYRHRSRYASR